METGFAKLQPFKYLSAEEIDKITSYIKVLSFAPDELILEQEKKGDGLYIIKSGSVSVRVRLPGDVETEIAKLTTTDFFGEADILANAPSTATVYATEATECYFFASDYLHMFRLACAEVAYKITHSINESVCARIQTIRDQVAKILENPATPANEVVKPTPPNATSVEIKSPQDLGISLEFLSKMQLFAALSTKEITQMLPYMRLVTAPKYCVLFREGEAHVSCLIPISGAVQLTMERAGTVAKLNVSGPGGIVGHISFINQGIKITTCTVRESAKLLEMPQTNMEQLHQEQPELWYKFYDIIAAHSIDSLRVIDGLLIRLRSEFGEI